MKWQAIWETPKRHLKVHCFVLGKILKKLFYIDKLSRSEQEGPISDFQAEAQHNDSHYGCNKARKVKKEKGEEMLAQVLSPHVRHHVCDLSRPVPLLRGCHHGGPRCHWESVQRRPPPPHGGHGHQPWPPRTTCTDGYHHLCCKMPSRTTLIITKAALLTTSIKYFFFLVFPEKAMYEIVAERGNEGPGHSKDWNLRAVNPHPPPVLLHQLGEITLSLSLFQLSCFLGQVCSHYLYHR